MPAIAPPLSPLWLLLPAVAAVGLGDDVDDVIEPIEVVTGSLTFVHRVSVWAVTQQESVAFGELSEQYEHKLGRLFA